MKNIFTVYARYNSRINEQFYRLARGLSTPDLEAEKGLYFGSLLNTFNHIAVGDIAWLKRFATHPKNYQSLAPLRDMPRPERLDSILHGNFEDLYELRKLLDACIVDFISEAEDLDFNAPLSYQNFKGIECTKNFGLLVLHFFNHQTHHRGQISAVLSQLGVNFGTTDLLMEVPDIEA